MPQIKVTLSIGFSGATHEDVLDISDVEWDACETSDQRDDLMQEYWSDWSNNFIDGSCWLIGEEPK